MIDVWFVAATVVVLATPGPTNTLLAASGARKGVALSLPLLPAELVGYLVAISAWGLVLAPAAAAWPAVAPAARLACAAYLAVTALRLWHATPGTGTGGPIGPRNVFVATLLNPKGLLFAAAICPPDTFTDARAALAAASAFTVILLPIALSWISLGALLTRSLPGRGPLWVQRGAATAVALFSLWLGASTLA